jgi:tetratricopeptide (TPR) repeat protein
MSNRKMAQLRTSFFAGNVMRISHCLLVLCGCLSLAAASANAAVCLGSNEPQRVGGGESLLVREIVRQAILIAARDELALATRDQTLRESFPPDLAIAPLDIQTTLAPGKQVRVEIRQGEGPAARTWSHDFPIRDAPSYVVLPELPEIFEQASRGVLVEMLRTMGAAPAANPPAAAQDAPIPDDISQALEKMDLFQQFAAVRQLHELIRTQGSTPQRLGGIVRGYAHLGQLTQFQWPAFHQALRARSLLYAQRLVVADNASAHALRHRAYARALAGLHARAREDLAAADEAAAPETAAPAWVPMIDALARYDTSRLLDLVDANQPAAQLAAFFCFLTVEHSGSASVNIEFARMALEHSPYNFRVIDSMTSVAGVGYLHMTTVASYRTLIEAIYQELPDLPGLPPGIRQQILDARPRSADVQPRAQLVTALVQAGQDDQLEPSWEVLARFIEETFFVHTFRRAVFLAFQWGVGFDQTMALAREAKGLVGDHPYYPVLLVLGQWPDQAAVQRHLSKIPFRDLSLASHDFLQRTNDLFKTGQDRTPWAEMVAHHDNTAADLERYVSFYLQQANQPELHFARRLLGVSPHCPVAMAKLVADDWDNVQAQIPQWEQSHGTHPTFAAAMARHYTKAENLEMAQRMWENVLAVAPDYHAFRSLAEVHLQQGDETRWLEVMEQSLETEDYGLQHAQARVRIAEHFMSKGEHARALPYAEAAAETWAGWAMATAARCNDALRNYDRAELWMRRSLERYGGNGVEYYAWCKRTGHGNVAVVRPYLMAYFKSLEKSRTTALMGIYHLLEEQPQRAVTQFQQAMEQAPADFVGLLLALTHRQLDDVAASDKIFEQLRQLDHLPAEALVFKPLAIVLHDGFVKGQLDPAALKAAEQLPPQGAKAIVHYLVGWHHELAGDLDQATQRYAQACVNAHPEDLFAALAAVALRRHGLDPTALQ